VRRQAAPYERRLLYFVRRFVDDPDRALDVLQEIWVTVFRRIGTLKAPQAFRVWLYRIARDKAIDHLRGRSRELDLRGEKQADVAAIEDLNESDFIETIGNAEMIRGLATLPPIAKSPRPLKRCRSRKLRRRRPLARHREVATITP
jgi:RNA polymerase sigma-70 factor (ECF subfamily)